MPISVAELNEIRASASYARYVHTNLHVHTPATPWDWNNYPEQQDRAEDLAPEDYFDKLKQTSLELVAITDHNCVRWCEPLIDLARKARRAGESNLHILPGVEVTTYEGPHLIAIFDEDFPVEEIRNFLIRLRLSGEGRHDDRVHKDIPINKIINEVIDEMGGIVIGPHVHNKDGLWGHREFRGRMDILNDPRLRILAAPSGHIKYVDEKNPDRVRLLYKTMPTDQIDNSFAFINVSDCHRLDDFETDTTWIKMSRLSLEGVKQIVYEPELRVSHELIDTETDYDYPVALHFTAPDSAEHPHILGVAITGGMLDGERITFSPHQNCIIGKNYAGKSAVFDCIRFALGLMPHNEDAEERFIDRLRAIVTEGGEVRLYVQDGQGKIYGISKTLSCTDVGTRRNPKWHVEGNSVVHYLLDDEFHRETDVHPAEIFHAEVYPQGEVVKIKDNVSQQMSIVDALAKHRDGIDMLKTEEFKGETTLYGQLMQNSRQVTELISERNLIEEEIQSIPNLEEEIEKLETLADLPVFDEIQQWTEVEAMIDQHQKTLGSATAEVQALELSGGDNVEIDAPSLGIAETLNLDKASPDEFSDEATRVFQSALHIISDMKDQGLNTLSEAAETLATIEKAIQKRLDAANEAATAESEYANVSELTQRITAKKRRLHDLKAKERRLNRLDDEIEKLQDRREELKQKHREAWGEIHKRRSEIVELIDSDSADNIEAELIEDADRSDYLRLLHDVADRLSSATNRIGSRTHIDIIADATTPQQLIKIIRSGDANKLVGAADGITDNTARIFLGMGLEDIHRLELSTLGDKFEIRLKKEGDDHFTPIDGGLSGGEQALALISVAMIHKDRPLIVDQPEDELGPALITGDLVNQIRRVKPTRQMLFVTHIANIPVLADSEQVIYVEQIITDDGKNTRVKCCGSLDDRSIVERLLELDGGKAAFDKRKQRYALVTGE